jgi:suppressor for copper-sensitivity B
MRTASLWLVMILWAEPLMADVSAWQRTEHSSVRLLLSHEGEGELVGGLQFVLEDGWKTYWRSPGDAGVPARLSLEQSENVRNVELHWPVPAREIESWGLESYVYGEEVVLPFTLTRDQSSRDSSLRMRVDYMLCKQLCIPAHAVFSAEIPKPFIEDSESKRIIDRHLARVPEGKGDYRFSPLRLIHRAAGVWVEVVIDSAEPMEKADVFIEGPNGFVFGKPEQDVVESGKMIRFRLPIATNLDENTLEGETVRVTLAEEHGVAETQGTLSFDHRTPYLPGEAFGGVMKVILWVVVFAGAILLPVLTIRWRARRRKGNRV